MSWPEEHGRAEAERLRRRRHELHAELARTIRESRAARARAEAIRKDVHDRRAKRERPAR